MKRLIAICAFSLLAISCTIGHGGGVHPKTHQRQIIKEHHGPHIITTKSNANFDTTLSQLRAAIDSRGFTIFAVVDHVAGATLIGKVLRPTTLIIFGNPKGGAPLMQAEQRMGLELPLKILVTQDAEGAVQLTHKDMAHLFHEFGIAEMTMPLQKMEGALSAIVRDAGAE